MPTILMLVRYRWHIGGKQVEAVWCVLDALNAPETMTRTDV